MKRTIDYSAAVIRIKILNYIYNIFERMSYSLLFLLNTQHNVVYKYFKAKLINCYCPWILCIEYSLDIRWFPGCHSSIRWTL